MSTFVNNRIRIGKDITVAYNVELLGDETIVSAENWTWTLLKPNGETEELAASVVGSKVYCTYYGKNQKLRGDYTLTLWRNKGLEGETCTDLENIFRLVTSIASENPAYRALSEVGIEVSGTVYIGFRGEGLTDTQKAEVEKMEEVVKDYEAVADNIVYHREPETPETVPDINYNCYIYATPYIKMEYNDELEPTDNLNRIRRYTFYIKCRKGEILESDTLEFARYINAHGTVNGTGENYKYKGWIVPSDKSITNSRIYGYKKTKSVEDDYDFWQITIIRKGATSDASTPNITPQEYMEFWYEQYCDAKSTEDESERKKALAELPITLEKICGFAIVRDGKRISDYVRFKCQVKYDDSKNPRKYIQVNKA